MPYPFQWHRLLPWHFFLPSCARGRESWRLPPRRTLEHSNAAVGTGGPFYQTMCTATTDASGNAVCFAPAAKYFTLIKTSPGRMVYADSDLTPKWYYGNGLVKAPAF